MLCPVQIDASNGVVPQEFHQRTLGVYRAALPKRVPKAVPRRGEAFLVGIRVLHDEPLQRFRLTPDDPEADRAAVVLNEQPILTKLLGGQKALDRERDAVERISVGVGIWTIAVAEARIVRRDHVEAIHERRDQVAVLM